MAEADVTEHPTLGGKSIESVQAQQTALASRRPYKSWRKKYRKMRVRFDAVLEENRRLFREEQKLEGLTRRLTEELDSLLEISLDINQNPAIAPELRYDISFPQSHKLQKEMRSLVSVIVPGEVDPEQANSIMQETIDLVQAGKLSSLDMQIVREQLQYRLAERGVKGLAMLESKIQPSQDEIDTFTRDNDPQSHPAFLSGEQEDAYLSRLDAETGLESTFGTTLSSKSACHQADLPMKELDRQFELMNPQSQHNWLRSHSKINIPLEGEDVDSASQDTPGTSTAAAAKSTSRRRSLGKNLARQLGDRAVQDRIGSREGYSPSNAFGDDDELGYEDIASTSSRRKSGADKDPTFRSKVSKGGSTKAKRKRATDEGVGNGGGGGSKRMRAADIFD